MRARSTWFTGWLAFLLVASPWPVRAQDETVHKQLTSEQMENILKSLNVEYKKVDGGREGTYFYDFTRQNYKLRLHFFGGKDIMLDALFKDFPLDKLNQWNTKAKFSRASLHKDDKGPFTAVESNLDILGGVTQGTIEQFFKSFDQEVRAFDTFIGGSPSPGKDEKIVTNVSDELIEKLLGSLNLKYKKVQGKGVTAFDFEANRHALRLSNFGGKDLMIDARFKVIPLEKINKYNIDNKFIRAVYYKTDKGEHVALESNLDCVGGVSESIIRYFINEFNGDVKKFAKYVQDNQD